MVTRSRPAVTMLPALALVLLSACTAATPAAPSSSAPAPSASASSVPAPAPSEADAATLTLAMADSSLGTILVDGKGMTLYLFTKDTPNTSNCTGQCLAAWPPLLGKPTAGKGVDAAKLGSFTRADGSTQASYNGWPLYYWEQDSKPGDVTGQDVNKVWYVLNRDGTAVKG
ncbi:hypothetical protein [Micropruina sp.]|uniref:COG4315 family predicted lipoprotein n=1 Tax=Micropruina sp. TaxID=2737536 RepID=UPI0039E32117